MAHAHPFFGLDASVQHAARRLPAILAPSAAIREAAARFAEMPAALSNWLYFEVRLDERHSAQVDVSTRIRRPQRDLLLTTPVLQEHESPVPGLARWWGDASTGSRIISQLWLEFDVPVPIPSAPPPVSSLPGIFIELTAAARLDDAPAVRCAALLQTLPHLLGHEPPPALIRAVTRAVGALPPHADVMYVGSFAGRHADTVRLCAMRMADADIEPYLRRIGWPGDAAAVGAEIDTVCARKGGVPRVGVLNIDVSVDGVRPRLGLELPLPRAPQYRGALPDGDFLDDLVARRIVGAAYRDALRRWPGAERIAMTHELWPSVAARCVNHLKLIHVPGEPLAAKAYLAWTHLPAGSGVPAAQ
ncbi:MAG: hypothetical protein IT355_13625 [Gemmatimonadaceae bacterium]|nr:hypothetical protein [Gemmatimonadaceae bacterium]